jgi:hypothetical protein
MKNIIVLLAVAAVLLAIAPATQADINLPDPGVVGSYRVAFVTSQVPSSRRDLGPPAAGMLHRARLSSTKRVCPSTDSVA